MKNLGIIVGVLCVLHAAAGLANAGVVGAPVVNPANGHAYYLLEAATWTDSQAEAILLGGDLVTINDADEDAWVFNTFHVENRNLWIGLNDAEEEGTWVWVSEEPVTYTNWYPGEPNNAGDEDYAHLDGQNPDRFICWNDIANAGRLGWSDPMGVVEVVPEPATMTLLAFGAVALLRRRKK